MTAAALFQIATGLAFAAVLFVGLFARAAIRPLSGRIIAFGMVAIAAGTFLVYLGLNTRDQSMLTYAAGAFILASLLLAVGLAMAARRGG